MLNTVISEAETSRDFSLVRQLFHAYQSELGIDLGFQDFQRELDTLPGAYRRPRGCLLLARDGEGGAGCVALRPFKGKICEMKRLYVRPEARGTGLGRALAEHVIERARGAGYERMVLDTLQWMEPARSLYRSLGFRETAPYYPNPIDGAVYMALDIDRPPPTHGRGPR